MKDTDYNAMINDCNLHNNCCNATDEDYRVLEAAFEAWRNWGDFRRRRQRNKDFTYGRQWGDLVKNDAGQLVTEGELASQCGKEPLTNNLLRQLIKCVVGRFRKSIAKEVKKAGNEYRRNCINELDARALEEFLISGCCVQRVERDTETNAKGAVRVDNVNVNRFFSNVMEDVLGRDCEIVGELHDMRVGELIMRLAATDINKARRIRNVYSSLNSIYSSPSIGADSERYTSFWQAQGGKCRAIEVWTLQLVEVLHCHDFENSRTMTLSARQLGEIEAENKKRRKECRDEITVNWGVEKEWHCRWFAPDGTLLSHYVPSSGHRSHPFVFKMFPLTDGEIHAFVEDVIDQQKYVNRLITIIDHIMNASAKGVLLFPEASLPDGFSWRELRHLWANSNSIIPYTPDESGAVPQQIIARNTDIGAYQLLNTQMNLIEDISGVPGVLRGQAVSGQAGVKLYESQLENADTALADIYESFGSFRRQRNLKASSIIGSMI